MLSETWLNFTSPIMVSHLTVSYIVLSMPYIWFQLTTIKLKPFLLYFYHGQQRDCFCFFFGIFFAFSYKLPNFHSNQTTKKIKTTLNGAVGPTRHPNKERGGKLPCSALPPAWPARRRRAWRARAAVGRPASGAARAGPRAGLARPRPSRGAGGGGPGRARGRAGRWHTQGRAVARRSRPGRGKAAAGLGGAALRESERPSGARRRCARPSQGGPRRHRWLQAAAMAPAAAFRRRRR